MNFATENTETRRSPSGCTRQLLVSLCLCASAAILLAGCTVVPKPVVDKTPSFDGNQQNSGFLGYAPDGSGMLTESKAAEYNALADVHGAKFVPPLKRWDGIRATGTNVWLMDKEHIVKFARMLEWRRSGK